MKVRIIFCILLLLLCSCSTQDEAVKEEMRNDMTDTDEIMNRKAFTLDTRIEDVINYPGFGNYGRLIFPVNGSYYSGNTLKDLRLIWYSNIIPDTTLKVISYLKEKADTGETIFYDIYSEEEKREDPTKEDTGLFFFKGKAKEKFAICNAGGGMVYVGAIHDSFPHALELSERGYNAFVLIYRPGFDTAMEDLGRAIAFVVDHADELEVDPKNYSLWGGSAGARMAATLGNSQYLAYYTDREDLPQAVAVIMQYTGHGEVSAYDAPTYACIGKNDGIADWRIMKERLDALNENYGIPVEFHLYEGLGHGFGLGENTVAEGWIDDAIAFWEENVQ